MKYLLLIILPVFVFADQLSDLEHRIKKSRHISERCLRNFDSPLNMNDIYYLHGCLDAFDEVLLMIEAIRDDS